ncbi:MAG: periplasmic heavy metal sensor [Gemmatimonadota bacterium]|nr:periplasmic heavy metal sensor [Gemmatimonadota bacterium]
MRRTLMLTIAAAVMLPLAAAAQERMPHEEGFERHLFPPELVMRHQQQLQLTDQQRNTIKEAVQQLHTQTVEYHFQLQEQNQALSEMLARESVDSRAALAQMGRMLDIEGQVKRMHLELLIRIKNTLTAEQQEQLGSMREHQEQSRLMHEGREPHREMEHGMQMEHRRR